MGVSGSSAKSATVNISSELKKDFISQVQQIRDCLKQQLESVVITEDKIQSLENFINHLATDINQFNGKSQNLSFQYNFNKKDDYLQKRRLSLQSQTADNSPLLKFHKLTVTVENPQKFDEDLQASLNNFISQQKYNQIEQEDLNEILDDLVEKLNSEKSDLYHLKRLMDREALGKVQREAKIQYLEFLKEHLGNHQHIIYLEDLIRRLRLLENYINDINKVDGDYEVNYAGITANYRTIFSDSRAFDELPIIPLIVGHLGETTDENRNKQQFVFGLKLKLAGKVQARGGKTVIDYYLNLLDTNSQEHKEGLADPLRKEYFVKKVLRIAFLYYFIFATIDPSTPGYKPEHDLDYDPIKNFEEKVLPIFQHSNESQKESMMRGIKRGIETYQASHKVENLKAMLRTILQKKPILPQRSYPIHISLKKGILEEDFNTISQTGTFFQSVLRDNPKAALKYISVNPANVDATSLCTLTANIQISEIAYYSTNESQSFSMEYDIRKIFTIPVLLTPQKSKSLKLYQDSFGKEKLIEFNYNHERLRKEIFNNLESHQIFVYKFTFSLLAYISLKILLDASKPRLFIPILRLHLNNKQDPSPEEKFLRSMFAVLSHLLNEKHRSNSQGFYIKDIKSYKVGNALSSLYSVLPKTFKLSQPQTNPPLDKLAIIVVSSRECDRAKSSNYKIANLMGEMTGVQRQKDGSIRLYMIGTLSDNYNVDELYRRPDVLIDEVNELYKLGFRHLLYIAKSPYSNTLHMTNTEQDEELYFMSKAILRDLKAEREDLKIYPIFFDKYYAVNLQNIEASSLYIQDVAELETIAKDPSQQSVVFFNLFNGIQVGGNKGDKHYNGVISYATLLNIYEGVLDDQDIREGLIYDTPLKNELLQMLTLYHFSRYEASSQKINLKLDPYENLIGDDSVGALSIFKHMKNRVNFNLLAFLVKVKKALNVKL
ncbi:MAG: hypothetical protein AAFO04_19195 [Cyanobacteria bacterium J06592_8]